MSNNESVSERFYRFDNYFQNWKSHDTGFLFVEFLSLKFRIWQFYETHFICYKRFFSDDWWSC